MMVKLIAVLMILSCLLQSHVAQRTHVDPNLRGQSFGLENFLFQTYEDAVTKDDIRNVKPKRIRPTVAGHRTTPTERLHNSYELDNLGVQQYESSRLKPTKPTPIRRPVEHVAQASRIKENYVMRTEDQEEEQETPVPEIVTERIRKRIMMRRRRKRPSNGGQNDGNSEITGNAIVKPVRIPVYPQVPKVVVRTKLPDQDNYQRVKSVGVKSITPQPIEEERTTITEKTTTTTTAKPSTINLKTFLKQQTETLSLSELLQTQNLSLADLLRGNKDASAILKARQSTTTTTTTAIPSTTATVRRKQFNSPPTEEPPKTAEIIEATTSRPNYNRFLPKVPRIKPAEVKPVVEETPEEVSRPAKRPGFDHQNRLSELRSKLRNFQRKTNPPATQLEITSPAPTRDETIEPVTSTPTTTETPLYKKNRVSFKSANNPDISLIIPSKTKPELENLKRPERLSNWTNRLPSLKRTGLEKTKQEEIPAKPLEVPEESYEEIEEPKTTPKTIEEPPLEEPRKPEAKDELIELLKSGHNADKLQKILVSRNMTLQELLDNREKPTQTDISELFSKRPESTQPTLFDSLPDFEMEDNNRFEGEKDAIEYDEPEAEESVHSIARVELVSGREAKQFDFQVPEKEVVSKLNLQPDDLAADTSNAENLALWKLAEKSLYYGNSYGYGHYPTTSQKPNTDLTESDIILLETIRSNQETNRKFKIDFNDFVREEEPQAEDIEKSYIPPAVKSAIIASGVVMGIALFVFIAIFAACGWKQRQIRLKGTSSILGGTLSKVSDKSKRTNTLSPVSFKDSHSYKKTIDFDEETSESGRSNTSSYLWNTLKNTFTSRTSTLKSRFEKEEKMREDKTTLRRNESRRKVESRTSAAAIADEDEDDDDDRPATFQTQDERYTIKKIDRDRNVINTSFNFKRSTSNTNISRFDDCVHGY